MTPLLKSNYGPLMPLPKLAFDSRRGLDQVDLDNGFDPGVDPGSQPADPTGALLDFLRRNCGLDDAQLSKVRQLLGETDNFGVDSKGRFRGARASGRSDGGRSDVRAADENPFHHIDRLVRCY